MQPTYGMVAQSQSQSMDWKSYNQHNFPALTEWSKLQVAEYAISGICHEKKNKSYID